MRLYSKKQEIISRQILLMGDRVEIHILCDEDQWPENLIESAVAEMRRIEDLFTGNNVSNPIKQINAQAGLKPVKVNKEIYDVISRCMHVLEVTQDAFKMIYYFNSTRVGLPGDAVKSLSLKKKHTQEFYRHVEFDKQLLTIFLNEKGLHLNVRNIAKGYAKDRAKYLLKQNGVSSGIIKSTGEIVTWGSGFTNRIAAIDSGNFSLGDFLFSGINISGSAIVTAGINDAHPVIDRYKNVPRQAKNTTGGSDIHSITLICPSATMACCIHPFLVEIGLNNSLELINQMQGVAAIFIDNNDTVHTSKNTRQRKSSTLCAI